MAPNTEPAKFITIKTRRGSPVRLRIYQLRKDWHDFLFEVYPENAAHGICQIVGEEYFLWKKGLKQFFGQADVDLDINSEDEWRKMFDDCLAASGLTIPEERKS
jgi:hypothetical protein